jgi:glucuronate isomerase
MFPAATLEPHPDGLFPADAGTWRLVRELCETVAERPIISPSRRLDAGFLAQLIAEHRLSEDEAVEAIHDLVITYPRRAFKL